MKSTDSSHQCPEPDLRTCAPDGMGMWAHETVAEARSQREVPTTACYRQAFVKRFLVKSGMNILQMYVVGKPFPPSTQVAAPAAVLLPGQPRGSRLPMVR